MHIIRTVYLQAQKCWEDTSKIKEEGKNAPSLLRKVQEKGRDQRTQTGHLEEQAACCERHMPVLRDKGIQNREGLKHNLILCPAQSGEPSLCFHNVSADSPEGLVIFFVKASQRGQRSNLIATL